MNREQLFRRCERDGCENVLTGRQRMWCSDNCRKRVWDSENRLTCIDCREPLGVGVHRQVGTPAERCVTCERKRRNDGLTERVEFVARLYNESKTTPEIRQALGWTGHPGRLINEARQRGLIGYRNRGYGEAA